MLCLFNISHSQFYSELQYNGETISTRFRRRTSHKKIKTYDESYCEDAIVRIVLNFRKPGEETLRRSVAGEDRSGRLDKGTDLFEASDHHYREQFMESFSSKICSKLDDDRAWSSQEWKTEVTAHDRSGQLDKTSLKMVRKVPLDHEEILLDGTAQSVRNGETLRDRSGQRGNINSQEVAKPFNFFMGIDDTELDLPVESKSFVNRVNHQVRKRQKRLSTVARDGEEHSMIW